MPTDLVRKILLGEATSDVAYRKEIVKEIIYRASDLLAVGTQLLPVSRKTNLDVKFTYPGEMEAEYPVAEGRRGKLSEIDWPSFGYSLLKGQGRFRITKEAKIRGQSDNQRTYSMRRCAEAIAKKQDAEIIDAIIAGAGQTVTIAAGDEWDTAKGDPEQNIVDARQLIMDQSNITNTEIRSLGLLVSTNISSVLLKMMLIGNVQQTLKDYLKNAFGMIMLESRDADLVDDAYLVVTTRNTGEHGYYDGPAADLVEEYPVPGVGKEWLVTKFFKSKILPDVATGTTSNRIVKIANTKA